MRSWHSIVVLLMLGIPAMMVQCAQGAILTNGTVNTTPPSPANLTTAGTLDWAIWNNSSGTAVPSIAATNRKSGGPGLFSDITSANVGSVRGVGSLTHTFTYTDGISPVSQTGTTLGGVIHNTLGVATEGVHLEITGSTSQAYLVQIWATGGNSNPTGQMTASLAGASNIVLNSQAYAGREGTLFSFTFRPDNAADKLILNYRLLAATANGFVGIQAAAVSVTAVPEPSTLVLGGLGVAGALLIFRRNRGKRVT